MSAERPIDVVLFDVGGVIVQMHEITVLGSFNGRSDAPGILSLWLDCPHVSAHERGRIDAQEFARRIVATYGLDCTPEAFLQRCLDWHAGLFPGVEETLLAVRSDIRVACLSNTSEFSWSRAPACMAASRLFATQFLSCRLGVMKPDPAIYRAVIDELGCAPERILFFDDTDRHVAGARAMGFQAHRVSGIGEARDILRARGLLRLP